MIEDQPVLERRDRPCRSSPEHFVDQINVPVFLAGDWQDEQTGPYFANLLDQFTGNEGSVAHRAERQHADSLDPTVFARWVQFLSIYVAQKVPKQHASAGVRRVGRSDNMASAARPRHCRPIRSPNVDDVAAGEGDRSRRSPASASCSRTAAAPTPGAPVPRFEADYPSWPVPGTTRTPWYFDADGALVDGARRRGHGADSYTYDPSPSTTRRFPARRQSATWAQAARRGTGTAPAAGNALAYETAPLDHDVTVIGNASVDLWLKSTAPDTDVQVTHHRGAARRQEMFVQSGWLRASDRALAPNATELRPTHPLTEAAVETLPGGQVRARARVEVFPFAHVFRAGSRIRVIIDAPGGSRPAWAFDALPHRSATR